MTHKTRCLPVPDAVNFLSFMTADACMIVRFEGVHRAAMAVHTGKVLHDDMPGMSHGSVHGKGPLRGLIPVAFRTRLPRRLRPVGLGLFPPRREYELDEQPVLLKQTELVAVLAQNDVVRTQLPCSICLSHEVATTAEVRVLLDIVIVPDGDHNTEDGDGKQQRNEDRLFLGGEAPVQMVEYFGEEFVHGEIHTSGVMSQKSEGTHLILVFPADP